MEMWMQELPDNYLLINKYGKTKIGMLKVK